VTKFKTLVHALFWNGLQGCFSGCSSFTRSSLRVCVKSFIHFIFQLSQKTAFCWTKTFFFSYIGKHKYHRSPGRSSPLSPMFESNIASCIAIDYWREDGRFRVSTSCVTISNPDSLSSSETGDSPGIRSWKKHLSEWARCQKAMGGIYFTQKLRAQTLQHGSEFDNVKARLDNGIFKEISWLSGSVFRGWW
jgi:hypothetical protein